MKLLYVAPRDFPRRVANRVQTMKMAEAFSRHSDFVLVVSKLHCTLDELWDFYGITHPFEIETIGEPRLRPMTPFYMPGILASIFRHRPQMLYLREELPAWALSFAYRNMGFELLDYLPNRSNRYPGIVRRSRKTFVISKGLRETAIESGLPAEKLELLPDGVDLSAFAISDDKLAARTRVRLPADGKIVLYTGRLSDWKGVDVLVKSAKLLPEQVRIVIVGGFEGEPQLLQQLVDEEGVKGRVEIREFVPHSEVPYLLKAADVLVIPNKPTSRLSTHHTSPLKLFEYMASERPIVVSDLPSMREIVDDDSAVLVSAGDPEALARGLMRAIEGGPEIDKLVVEARKRVGQYSWDARAKHVLASLEK
jgi:glycosyltransferase involved in cell wall biosynthesis